MRNVPFLEYLTWTSEVSNKAYSDIFKTALYIFINVTAVVVPLCIPLVIYKLL